MQSFMFFNKTLNTQFNTSEYKHLLTLRVFSLIFTGVIIFGFGTLIFFLQQKVFSTIEQVNSIIYLRAQLGITTLNLDRFVSVEKNWKEKYSITLPEFSRNPFNLVLTPEEENITTSSTPFSLPSEEQSN